MDGRPGAGYWYAEDEVRTVLQALRAFRRADQEMRRRMSAEMDMNVTDLQAVQHVIAQERAGEPVTPRLLSAHLGISTPSTTKLLDRLTESGYLTRAPHPSDRRSLVVLATEHAHHELRRLMTRMHERMAEIAVAVPPACRSAVVTFLQEMAAEMDSSGRDGLPADEEAASGNGELPARHGDGAVGQDEAAPVGTPRGEPSGAPSTHRS